MRTMAEGKFRLIHVFYLSPKKQIRYTPKETWYLFIDSKTLPVKAVFDSNPTEFTKLVSVVEKKFDKKLMKEVGKLPPSSPLNPNKQLEATSQIIDSGKVNILNHDNHFISLWFKGKKIKGYYVFKRERPNGNIWIFSKSKLPNTELELQLAAIQRTKHRIELLRQLIDFVKRKNKHEEMLSQDIVDEILKHPYVQNIIKIYGVDDSDMNYDALSSELKVSEEFQSEFKIPLPVTGIAITEGTHKGVFYSAEELEKAASDLAGKNIFINHDKRDASKLVGRIEKSWYDSKIKGIRFEGWIEDEKIASKVYYGLLKHVSVGAYSRRPFINGKIHAVDIEFAELSIVVDPADKNSEVKTKED